MHSFSNHNCLQCPFQNIGKNCLFHETFSDQTPFHFDKGEVIFSEKKTLKGVYCIREGLCLISKNCRNGRNQIIELLSSGTLLGIRSILCEDQTNLMAKAILPVSGCYLPKKAFFHLIKNNPSFSLEVTKTLARYLKRSDNKIVALGQKSMYQRVAEILLELPDYFSASPDGFIEIKLTREDLANLAGIATESLIRILSYFKQQQWIVLEGKKLMIEAPKKLAQFSQGHIVL